jgi:hypothetical protein
MQQRSALLLLLLLQGQIQGLHLLHLLPSHTPWQMLSWWLWQLGRQQENVQQRLQQ